MKKITAGKLSELINQSNKNNKVSYIDQSELDDIYIRKQEDDVARRYIDYDKNDEEIPEFDSYDPDRQKKICEKFDGKSIIKYKLNGHKLNKNTTGFKLYREEIINDGFNKLELVITLGKKE